MNIESMRIKSYRSFAVDETPLPPAAAERLERLDKYDDLRANGCARAAALRHASLSRRTLCRWKAARGAIPRASLCEGRPGPRRRRSFNNWARRWRYGARAGSPGELVRIDHMTHTRDGRAIKEFRAICLVTRFMVSRVRSRATARNAGRFLDEALAAFPFAAASIQVDGGSEFMAEFEDACAGRGIPLHVLPPRRPQWNGHVERANRSARIEFWNRYRGPLTVAGAAGPLAEYEFFHNYVRPHAALEYQTPNEYLVTLEAA